MRNLLLLTVALLLSASAMASEHYVLDLQTMQPTQKDVDLTPAMSKEITGDVVNVSISIRYVAIDIDDDGYGTISVPGFAHNANPGEPQWLLRRVKIPLQEGYSVNSIVNTHDYVDLPIRISLAKEPQTESGVKQTVAPSKPYAITSGLWPELPVVKEEKINVYRGQEFVYIQISPVQYDQQSETARISRNITFSIVNTPAPAKSLSPDVLSKREMNILPDDSFVNSFFYTPADAESKKNIVTNGELVPKLISPGYLILTTPTHYAAAEKLAAWKRMMGMTTMVFSRSSWTAKSIKSFIKTQASQIKDLYYVLLIGDAVQMPGNTEGHTTLYPAYYSDYEFACIDGDEDQTADLYIGRIPASTEIESKNAIEKIISYERYPVDDPNFYKTSFIAAEFEEYPKGTGEEDRMFIYDAEEIKNKLESNYDFNITRIYASNVNTPKYWSTYWVSKKKIEIPKELQRPTFSWSGTRDNIVQAINQGSLFGLYRGHGEPTQWSNIIKFNSYYVQNRLNNRNKYPVIFSITCLSGAYYKDDNCLAKSFITQADAGAVGVIAASEGSESGYSDILTGSIFNSLWTSSDIKLMPLPARNYNAKFIEEFLTSKPKPIYNLGRILFNAFDKVDGCYSELKPDKNSNDSLWVPNWQAFRNKTVFHCFGDPSLLIHTLNPLKPELSITRTDRGFIIDKVTQNYPDGAQICIVDTIRNQIKALEYLRNCIIEVEHPERCRVCVTGHNIHPLITDQDISPKKISKTSASEERFKYYDFSSGDISEITKVQFPEIANEVITHENGDIEYRFNGAFVKYDEFAPEELKEAEKWYCVHTSEMYITYDDPASQPCTSAGKNNYQSAISTKNKPNLPLPTYQYVYKQFTEPPFTNVELIESEYVEFANVELMRDYTFLECDHDRLYIFDFDPWTGFWPDRNFNCVIGEKILNNNRRKCVFLELFPIQYNYETKTMRCYHKFVFRPSGGTTSADTIEAPENEQVTYYTIDGRVEPSPAKGRIYIRKCDGKCDKVVF